jgi:hypothetical protein
MTNLPVVKPEIFSSLTAELDAEKIGKWMAKLATENPQIAIGVDALEKTGSMMVAAYVYALLNSQAEADTMNKDFT